MRFVVWTLGLSAVAACSASGRSLGYVTDGGSNDGASVVDAGRVDAKGDGGPIFAADADLEGRTCERPIDVGALTLSMETCFVNEHVANRSGTLSYPCEGGAATLAFATGKKFTGTVDGDKVELELIEPFVFNACQWESTETIRGDLSKNELAYVYTEKPLAACTDTPCTADGKLAVESGEVIVVK